MAVIKSNDQVQAVGRFIKMSRRAENPYCSMEARHCFGSFPCGLCSLVNLFLVSPHLHRYLYHLSSTHVCCETSDVLCSAPTIPLSCALHFRLARFKSEFDREGRALKKSQDSGVDSTSSFFPMLVLELHISAAYTTVLTCLPLWLTIPQTLVCNPP